MDRKAQYGWNINYPQINQKFQCKFGKKLSMDVQST